MTARLIVCFIAFFALTMPASAHWADDATVDAVVSGRSAVVDVSLPLALVAAADSDRDGRLSPAELSQHQPALKARFGDGLRLVAAGDAARLVTVAPGPEGLAAPPDAAGMPATPAGGRADRRRASLRLTYDWPPARGDAGEAPIKGVALTYDLFPARTPEARCLVQLTIGGRYANTVLSPASPTLIGGEATPWWASAGRFVVSGVEHIAFGLDHVLFVVSLLMLGGGLRYIVQVVTAFTVAHSITLTLAVLGLVRAPGAWVEPAIALTIVWVAAENLWRERPEGRWIVTFAFGLIHGLGFAGALAESGLPTEHLAVSLASFNVGVELGQLAIVAVVSGVLVALRGRPFDLPVRRTVSGAVVLVGLYWFVERVWG